MKYGYKLPIIERTDSYIKLSNGCMLSVEDEEIVRYITSSFDGHGYPRLRESLNWKSREKVHRVVMQRVLRITLPKHLVVDHINNDKLDNRRENLQLTSHRNNVTKNSKAVSSKFYRVSSHGRGWRIVFNVQPKKPEYFGYYDNEEDAAYWADVWAVKLLPEGTLLNFPARLDEYKVKASELKCQG